MGRRPGSFFSDLRSIDIFDTSSGGVFVNSEDEVSYEPPVLAFFSSLIAICEEITSALNRETTQNPSRKPEISDELKTTLGGIWFAGITDKTSLLEVAQNCSFTEEDEKELKDIQQRFADPDPLEKAKQLRKRREHINILVQMAQKHLDQLSNENFRRIIVTKKNALLKKNAADAVAQEAFKGGYLDGIGSDIWKELWAAARKYSITLAYRDQKYPNIVVDSRCVLCQQTLLPETKATLLSFEEFVKGEMQTISDAAARELNTIIQKIEDVPTTETLSLRIEGAGLEQNEIASQLIGFFLDLKKRREEFIKFESEGKLPECDIYLMSKIPDVNDLQEKYKNTYIFTKTDFSLLHIDNEGNSNLLNVDFSEFSQINVAVNSDDELRPIRGQVSQETLRKILDIISLNDGHPQLLPVSSKLGWIEEVRKISTSFEKRAENYDKDAQNGNRDALKSKLNNLRAKKWLFEQRTAVEQEIERLKLQNLIQAAKKLTNTTVLSQKKGELAERLITDAFVQRFNAELKSLGACRVKVELVKSKVTKGRVLHKLQLHGASNSSLAEVLSEGERRIVSIAAFLADVTGKSHQAPFIFDDPISSLDQSYEESVVQRLIDLSCDKQVIIFTHRLSLLGTIRNLVDKRSIELDVVSIRSTDWGTGEPAPIPLSQSDIKTALNILINERYPEVKKANDAGNFNMVEILIKSICSDFRILLERAIENDLLCGVVQRFQRPVHTLKLKDLTKLKVEDCELLDSLMTKYSAFEHSQPPESPIELPTLEALFLDLTRLKNWREEYIRRVLNPVPKE